MTIALTIGALLAVSGCASSNMGELQSWVSQVLAKKGRPIEPPPEIRPYEIYAYRSADELQRDPFRPLFQETEKEGEGDTVASTSGLQPDLNRNREELEGFPLDSLRMVGTLEQSESMWGIILDPEGTVHRVKVGNYIGRNHGKILNISEEGIELSEILSDGRGGWIEGEASLALAE